MNYRIKSHLFGFIDIFRTWMYIQCNAKSLPRANIADICTVKDVELLHQGRLEIIMGILPFGIVTILCEVIAHAIELLCR